MNITTHATVNQNHQHLKQIPACMQYLAAAQNINTAIGKLWENA